MAYGFRKIGVVTSIPAPGTKPGSGDAADAYVAELGSVLEVTVKAVDSASGTLTLLRWFPPPQSDAVSTVDPAGEWRRWREDAPIQVGVTVGTGFYSGRYEQPDDGREYWLLLASAGPPPYGGTPTVFCDAQSVYYRGRK